MTETAQLREATATKATKAMGANRTPTGLLLQPYGADACDERTAVLQSARSIPRILADLAVPRSDGGSFRLTDHEVRRALEAPLGVDRTAPPEPFIWSSRTARRSVALSALRAMTSGVARTPFDGVRHALDTAIAAVRQGEASAASMDRWLCGLKPSGLAAVQADSVTWATRLWCGLDWEAFYEAPLIGRDHWWDSPHSSLLALRSRAEVRSVVTDSAGNPFSVHLVVLGGPRRSSVRSELAVVGLIEALRARAALRPGRVVGWWPDSGHTVSVEIDERSLQEGVAAVTRTLASAGASPLASERVIRAAA